MSWSEYLALLTLATAISFSPGPNTTLSAALAANKGLRGSLRFVCSVPVGWGLLFVVCAYGVGSLVLQVPALKWAVKAVGTGYLLWLALKLAGSSGVGEVDTTRLNVGFAQGVALQFLNIKAWMLALSVVAGWVVGRAEFEQRLMQVLPTVMAFAFVSNFSYALMGAGLRDWLSKGSRLLVFNRCMAAVLAVTALWMVTV
jgi:threonine/homoserine/homoserine lactone efflux protein